MADLVIRGGTVIDGTGAPGGAPTSRSSGDRIAAIGPNLSGARTLDASGCVVAPGFIDIHTHYDAQVFWDPALTPSCFHGVTTVVAGNCGFSIAPTRPAHREVIARTLENVEDMNPATLAAGIPWDFETHPEYLASVGRRGTALNFGAYVGHTAIRLYVMGDAAYERKATRRRGGAHVRGGARVDARPARSASPPASRPPTSASTASPCRAASPSSREFEAMARVLARARPRRGRRDAGAGLLPRDLRLPAPRRACRSPTPRCSRSRASGRWARSSTTRRRRRAPTSGRRSRAARSPCSCA